MEVEAVYEFGGGPRPMGYDARGHVDPDEFVAAILKEYGVTIEAGAVQHTFFRNVPVGRDRPGEMVRMECRPGRGAYASTWVECE